MPQVWSSGSWTPTSPNCREIVDKINGYRNWTDPLLKAELEKAPENSAQKLHASLALLAVDPRQAGYLYERLLDAEPQAVPVIREALAPHKQALTDKLRHRRATAAGEGKPASAGRVGPSGLRSE